MSVAEQLNNCDDASVVEVLTKCCAARRWVQAMAHGRPYSDDSAVMQNAVENWAQLNKDDWLEAFVAHPRIGDMASLRAKFADTVGWASSEQAGVQSASDFTLRRLSELNADYETKFGYIFIVCATGKSADEVLAILESRMPNDSDTELCVSAGEQMQITLIRLQKLDK